MKRQLTEERKKRWREYNKSKAGRQRYKRWRRSAEGKAKLRERYEERKLWLDELKAKRGCRLCGEKNPLLLRFRLRDGQKAKFPPLLQNISRSKKNWVKVIKGSNVFCVRCLILEKQGRKPFGGRTEKLREMPEIPRQVAPGEAIEPERQKDTGKRSLPEKVKTKAPHNALTLNSKIECSTCRLKFIPKRRNKTGRAFCSSRCRLLFWAVRKIFELYSSGWGDGLKKIISELAEVKR